MSWRITHVIYIIISINSISKIDLQLQGIYEIESSGGGGAGGLANRCGILGNGETSVIGVVCIVILSSAVAVIREKSDPALPVWQFAVRSTLQTIL